jgi:hypothetical protein
MKFALFFLGEYAAMIIGSGLAVTLFLGGWSIPFGPVIGLGYTPGATPLWRLRKTLSHQPGIFWIGASYQALEAQHHYHDAFRDFFALYELRPLGVDQMRQALLALARVFGIDGPPVAAAASPMAMSRSLVSSASPPNVRSFFDAAMIGSVSNGVFLAISNRSATCSRAASADPISVSNWSCVVSSSAFIDTPDLTTAAAAAPAPMPNAPNASPAALPNDESAFCAAFSDFCTPTVSISMRPRAVPMSTVMAIPDRSSRS